MRSKLHGQVRRGHFERTTELTEFTEKNSRFWGSVCSVPSVVEFKVTSTGAENAGETTEGS
jgi:hypothetical protein